MRREPEPHGSGMGPSATVGGMSFSDVDLPEKGSPAANPLTKALDAALDAQNAENQRLKDESEKESDKFEKVIYSSEKILKSADRFLEILLEGLLEA